MKKTRDSTICWARQNIIGKYEFSHPAFAGKVAKFTDNSITHNLSVGGELLRGKIDVLRHIQSYLRKNLEFRFNDDVTHGTNRAFFIAKTRYKGKIKTFSGKDIELQFAVKSNGELNFYFIKFL